MIDRLFGFTRVFLCLNLLWPNVSGDGRGLQAGSAEGGRVYPVYIMFLLIGIQVCCSYMNHLHLYIECTYRERLGVTPIPNEPVAGGDGRGRQNGLSSNR